MTTPEVKVEEAAEERKITEGAQSKKKSNLSVADLVKERAGSRQYSDATGG